ncbi:Keratinocyte-associated transmembrane protein 2 [Galemys pyrenaicus]|uniref:Keratinocyte-associated transmembrane protein 2 n=1 Tax=Galemys pyrenaicus TaxID=202257 RepID=A0A8J6DGG4_GALPY|nr:Keratinocyte-associated transmembrane protein 2 [Galemys pyrenaicus]
MTSQLVELSNSTDFLAEEVMAAAALRRLTRGMKMAPLSAVGIQIPPLVLVLLLMSARAQPQTDLRSKTLEPDAPTPNRNVFTLESQIKPSMPQVSSTLLRTTNTEKSGRASVNPTNFLTQDKKAGNRADTPLEDRHLLRRRSSASITRGTQKDGDYGRPNSDLSASPRDNGSNVTLSENKGYMENEPSGRSLKNPYTNMEEDTHLIFHFVIVCLCVTLVYILYYNKRKIFLLAQKKKWCSQIWSQAMKYCVDQNVNEAVPSLTITSDYIF